jgi:hypothetical protein
MTTPAPLCAIAVGCKTPLVLNGGGCAALAHPLALSVHTPEFW